MEEAVKIISAVLGLVVGGKVGIIGQAVFWYVAGICYLTATVPLKLYKDGAKGFYSFLNQGVADTFVIIVWVLFILLIGIKFGIKLIIALNLHQLPINIDKALGAALGTSTGIIVSHLVFSS
ncbi:hypothetical protein JYT44_03025 [Caldithrix abyssi]|nr:hypothetical protein [Caldithrix abyssi]